MKVLFFLSNTSAYLDRIKLLRSISKRVEKFTLLIGNNDNDICFDTCKIVELAFNRGKFIKNRLVAGRTALSILNEDHYDIVHDTFGFLLPLFLRKNAYPDTRFVSSLFILNSWRVRYLWKLRDILRLYTSSTARIIFINSLIEKVLANRADYIILQSPGAYAYAIDVLPIEQSRLAWLPNNIDTDYWTPGNAVTNWQAGGCLRILNVGGGAISKGALVLVKTIHHLREMGIPATLTHAGGIFDRDRNEIMKEINQLGVKKWITFGDKVDRHALRDIYRDHDLFLYQTINDGSPRVVLEALACGLPVVASHHPGIDVIDPEEKFISFTQFDDVEAAMMKIATLSADPDLLFSISKLGRSKIDEHFSTEVVADRYIRFYEEIIQRNETNYYGMNVS